jgi:hypothetical protein
MTIVSMIVSSYRLTFPAGGEIVSTKSPAGSRRGHWASAFEEEGYLPFWSVL